MSDILKGYEKRAIFNFICPHCKSNDILAERTLAWNKITQNWQVQSPLDMYHCRTCGEGFELPESIMEIVERKK